MKVILLHDVAKIGRKHAVVDVPDGYAQNQLIPKGMAKTATPENLKAIVRLNDQASSEAKAAEGRFFELKEALKEKAITIKGLKNDNGHLFAAVKPEMIASAAKADELDIAVALIKLPTPIKTTGEHTAELVHGSHRFEFKINVE